MPYTTEELVRRTVGGVLRGDSWRGKALCSPCLVKDMANQLGKGVRKSEIGRAMDLIFKDPQALKYLPTYQCARCQKTMPCLIAAAQ